MKRRLLLIVTVMAMILCVSQAAFANPVDLSQKEWKVMETETVILNRSNLIDKGMLKAVRPDSKEAETLGIDLQNNEIAFVSEQLIEKAIDPITREEKKIYAITAETYILNDDAEVKDLAEIQSLSWATDPKVTANASLRLTLRYNYEVLNLGDGKYVKVSGLQGKYEILNNDIAVEEPGYLYLLAYGFPRDNDPQFINQYEDDDITSEGTYKTLTASWDEYVRMADGSGIRCYMEVEYIRLQTGTSYLASHDRTWGLTGLY